MATEPSIEVEVVYASRDRQTVLSLKVHRGTTVREAIERSGILQQYPEIDLNRNALGIFGRRVDAEQELRMDDRVEIYRPLRMDPKASRRRRASRS